MSSDKECGPFLAIALPPALVTELAGTRPVLSLMPEDIPGAGLATAEDAIAACLLIGARTDALDILAALAEAGFRGGVLVVAPPMPNPHMIERELNRAGKPMTVTLVVR